MSDVPARMAYHHLHSWLYGNVIHVELNFNLDASYEDFATRLNTMLASFETGGDFQEYIIFCFILCDIDFFPVDGPNSLSSLRPILTPEMVTCTLAQTMLELFPQARSGLY